MYKIVKYLYLFLLLSYILPDDLGSKDSVNQVINHDWKLNVFSLGNGMLSLGQFENGKPFKAMSLMAMKYYWLNEYKDTKDNDDVSERNRSFWWLLFLNFYGIIDSYVDYHLKNFPDNDDMQDKIESK